MNAIKTIVSEFLDGNASPKPPITQADNPVPIIHFPIHRAKLSGSFTRFLS